MKGSIKKAVVVGIAGATVLNSMPLQLIAQERDNVVLVEESKDYSLGDMFLKVGDFETTLSILSGNYYLDSNNRLVLDKDVLFSLSVLSKDNVKVSSGSKNFENDGQNGFILTGLDGSSVLKIENSISTETINLLDYLRVGDGNIDSCVVIKKSPSLEFKGYSGLGEWYNGYFSGRMLVMEYEFGIDNELSLKDYDIKAAINGVDLSSEDYTIDTSKNIIKVNIDISKNGLNIAGKEDSYDFNISISDKLGNSFFIKDFVNIDNKAPVASSKNTKYVVGSDGKTYLSTNDEGLAEVKVEVSEGGTGVKDVIVLNNGKEIKSSYKDGICSFTLSKEMGKLSPEISLEDNGGNLTVVKLSSILGVGGNDFDLGIPEVTFNNEVSGGTLIDDWYKGTDLILESVVENKIGGISKVKYTVNGVESEEVVNRVSHAKTFDLDSLADEEGIVNIRIVAYDSNGNAFSKNFKYFVDNTKPFVEGIKVSNSDKYFIYNNVAYLADDIVIEGSVSDIGSGVDKVEIISDGKVVGNSLPYRSSKSGSYSVKISDKVGNYTEYSLNSIVGSSFNSVFVSKNSPIIVVKDFSEDVVYVEGSAWYESLEELNFSVDSDNLREVKISLVDESGKVSDLEYISEDGVNYVASLKDLKDGTYTVNIEASTRAGKKSESTIKFGIDSTEPVISSASIEGILYNTENNNFFNGELVVSVSSRDEFSGIKNVELIDKDGVVVSELENGKLRFSESGEYKVRVGDNVGNYTLIDLGSLLGLSSNAFVKDSNSPIINYSIPENSLGTDKNIFGKDVISSIKITDASILDSVKVECNGVIVKESENVKSFAYDLDTKALEGSKDGSYNIKVHVKDGVGNISEEEYTIYVDTEAPVIDNMVIEGDFLDLNGFLWFGSTPSINVLSKDNLVSVDEYIILNDDGSERKSSTEVIELKDGDYAVKVVDSFGNTSKEYLFKESLKTNNGVVSIDNVSPNIDCSRPVGDVDGWFNKDVEYLISVTDNKGINSCEVSINGKVVDSFSTNESNVKNKTLKANTSKVDSMPDGSYKVLVKVIDNAGNIEEWSDTIFIDREAPTVESFIITADGYKEGAVINGTDKYGFYLKGATSVEVHVSDGDISSGMDKLHYSLMTSTGALSEGTSSIKNGVAVVNIPSNFKGFISAYATDKAGNKGSVNKPDGIISEDGNVHLNSSTISMVLPQTQYKDAKGYNLYNDSVSIDVSVLNKTSGIRSIEWGIGDDTKGVVNIDNEGLVTGDIKSIPIKEKNLVISLTKDLLINNNNSNTLNVWVKVIDRVGHVSEINRIVSIDKDSPVINVSYNETLASGYYDSNRVATISIIERNFNPSEVKFNGSYGSLSGWSNVGNNTWVASMVFDKDSEYQWGIEYTDMAGNKGNSYSSERFTVDKTLPILSVSFNNNNAENGNFFKEGRTATVSVKEKNFDASLVKLVGNGTIGGWSHSGDTHTASIVFNDDGEYEFSLDMTDLAGNPSSVFSSGKFIVDKTAPSININGVKNGVSYKDGATFEVSFSDKYLDFSRCSAKLVGRTNGEIELKKIFNVETGQFIFEGLPEELKYDDLYTLNISICDKSGNVSEESLTFSINRFGSQYAFLNELILNNNINLAEDVELVETSVDRLDIDSCTVVVIRDGKTIEVDESLISVVETGGVGAPWIYKYKIDKEAFTEDGKYQIQIFSKSLDGTNNSSVTQQYVFLLDTQDPEIIISGIENGEFYRVVSKKVTIDVRDLSGVASIKVKLNGDEVELSEENGIYFFTIDENRKSQKVSVVVKDNAGNSKEVNVEDFYVSSSLIQSVVYSDWFKVVSGVLGVSLVATILAVLLRRRKRNVVSTDEE